MNKLKKILSVVLSIGLVASTLVMPITSEAAVAASDVAYEYNFNDGTLNQSSGTYTAGAITNSYTGGTVSVVDGIGGKLDKVAMITRSSAGADLQTRVGNPYTEIFADAEKMTAEVEIYVPENGVTNTAGMGFMVLTNTTGMGDSIYAKIEFDKWSKWNGTVTINNATNTDKWNKVDTAANVAGTWHKLAVTSTKATSESAADGSMELYVDDVLVKTFTGLQIDKFYPDVRVTSQWRQDLADGACKQYFDNLKVYAGEAELSPYREKQMWLSFEASADVTRVGGTQVDGFAGKLATDKVVTATGTTERDYAEFTTTSDVVTYEASVYVPSGNIAQLHVFNTSNCSIRHAVVFRGNGNFGVETTADGGSIWDNVNNTSANVATYNQNTWNKVAIEYNIKANTVKFYLNGALVQTITGTAAVPAKFSRDLAFSNSGTFYVDNMRIYASEYQADEAITVTNVTDGKVPQAATIEAIKAYAAGNDRVEVYADAALTTVATSVNEASYLLVQKGELYATYEIVSPYGEKYVWNTFSSDADLTGVEGVAIVDGLAGKPASDKVGRVSAHTGYKSGTWSDDIITAEVQAYVPRTMASAKIELYAGTAIDSKDRPGVYIQNGKFGYVKANSWTYTDICDVDTTIWHKMAIEMNKSTGMTKIYLDGELVASGTDLFAYGSAHSQDWRIQNNGYADNWHIYNAPYVVDAAISTPSAVADGKFVIAEGTALSAAAATVTDGTAKFYTDTTYTTEATSTANAGYVLINKGELYKVYPVKVTTKYDGAILSTNFNAGSIDYAGDFAGNATGSWYNVNVADQASVSYTQIGGKDSKAWTVETYAYGDGTVTNARLQTGWGSANAKYSAGVYTVEAQLYKTEAVSAGSIGIKMRSESGANKIFQVYAPAVAHEWFKVALTVDTVNGTVAGYVNGEEADVRVDGVVVDSLTVDGTLYNIVSDQVNLTAADHQDIDVTTSGDNFRVYAGAYKGDTMPVIDEAVTMDAGATVADVIAETGADFVVDANGDVVGSATLAATGMKAVAVNGECYAYCDVTATALTADVDFDTLATGTVYEKDGVEYVFVAVTTPTITNISLYETFACTDGVDTKGIALSELMGTTLTGAAEIGVLVMNVPAANAANFKAKLVLAD